MLCKFKIRLIIFMLIMGFSAFGETYPYANPVSVKVLATGGSSYGGGSMTIRHYFKDNSYEDYNYGMYSTEPTPHNLSRTDLCKVEVRGMGYGGSTGIIHALYINGQYIGTLPYTSGTSFELTDIIEDMVTVTGAINGEASYISNKDMIVNNCTVGTSGKVTLIAGNEVRINGETRFTAGSNLKIMIGSSDNSAESDSTLNLQVTKLEKRPDNKILVTFQWEPLNSASIVYYLYQYPANNTQLPVNMVSSIGNTCTLEIDSNEYIFKLKYRNLIQ